MPVKGPAALLMLTCRVAPATAGPCTHLSSVSAVAVRNVLIGHVLHSVLCGVWGRRVSADLFLLSSPAHAAGTELLLAGDEASS